MTRFAATVQALIYFFFSQGLQRLFLPYHTLAYFKLHRHNEHKQEYRHLLSVETPYWGYYTTHYINQTQQYIIFAGSYGCSLGY